MIYVQENIYQFAVGVPVKTNRYLNGACDRVFMVGHVLGFALNPQGEVILRIQWATGEESTMHPVHVELLVKQGE